MSYWLGNYFPDVRKKGEILSWVILLPLKFDATFRPSSTFSGSRTVAGKSVALLRMKKYLFFSLFSNL